MTEQQASAEEVIDWAVALENTGGDEALLLELIGPFLEEAQKHLSDMHFALSTQDCVLLNRAAHTLKGSLRIVGASSAMLLAEELESHFKSLADDQKLIKAGKADAAVITPSRLAAAFEEAPRMVNELEAQVSPVMAALKARLGP